MPNQRAHRRSKAKPQVRSVHSARRQSCASPFRAKLTGAALLLASMMLVVYAAPCFAASIWDEGLGSQSSGTVFSNPISDNAYPAEEAAQAAGEAAAPTAVRAASKVNASVTETTGPGIALDDDAVAAAKKRVQAVSAAKAERDAVIGSISAEKPVPQDRTLELLTSALALVVALLFGILGTRSIMLARQTRAMAASLSYGNALKA